MNTKILSVLEFNKVIQQLIQYIATAQGQYIIDKLVPSSDQEKITIWLKETKEGADVLRLKGGIPVPQLVDIEPHLKRIEIGASLNGLEIAEIGRVLSTVQQLKKFFEQLKEDEVEIERLFHWESQLTDLADLTKKIRVSVEEDGHVTDAASQELYHIRQQIRRNEQNIREQLDGLIRGKNARYLSDTVVTMRNERYVIPVKQEYRGIFGGVVHDQSASGQTLFIEPRQIVDLNNRLRQQQIAERQEIQRILAELANEIAPYRREIQHNAYVIGQLDFIQAKAQLAKSMKATIPTLNQNNEVYFRQARHPLISSDVVVANDIMIGKDFKTIVVTGPNTGGKTISLKTLGLIQLMGQAGLALPVGETSQMGVFNEILADIGDEQSIEQNLSTFSSHMTNIIDILNKIDGNSLVLFDELGAGTDPQEGAALAIAILDYVRKSGDYVMATTHYPELKAYGYNRKETINASMEFNVDTLSPSYRLLIGVPGRSNAFEISQRLGLNPLVIQAAKDMIDDESQDLNEMITDLEQRRKMTETEYQELRYYVEEAEKLHHDLEDAYRLFYEEREIELNKAKHQANEVVNSAEEKAEKIIADIRNMQLRTGKNSSVKEHELIEARSQFSDLHYEEESLKKNKVLKKAKKQKAFKVGDEVLVTTYGQRGTLVESMRGGQWKVQMGILQMPVAESDLEHIAAEKEKPQRTVASVKRSNTNIPTQLDLRGQRYEEALHEVDKYIDAALLAGYAQVRIVHGKGTGALRSGITDFLKQHSSVKKFELAPQNQGGSGATIVYFK